MPDSLATILYGTEEPVFEPLALRAGPLRMRFQHGKLWELCVGDVEVWHGLAFVYRDIDWRTPEPIIDDIASTVGPETFELRIAGRFPTLPEGLPFEVRIEGRADGSLCFTAQATPVADVQTNRFGICLLHPASLGGARVAVRHTDGRESHSTIPTLVPPWPPFMLIQAIRHEYAPDRWAHCAFGGDTFEFEDQRNNSDASFKTYNRSNLMPRPYWLRSGALIRQSAELRIDRPTGLTQLRRPGPVYVEAADGQRRLPRIGIEIGVGDAAAGAPALRALQTMRLSHLHLAIESDAAVDWAGIAGLLRSAGAKLRLDVKAVEVDRAEASLEGLRTRMHPVDAALDSIAVFPSEPRCIAAARASFPTACVGGGTEHFFVQLHRAERLGTGDFLTFTTSPIVHGSTESEIMLTLQTLPSLVETLRVQYPQPIRIGPSTIGARNSPLGRQPKTDGTRRVTLARQDPRCRGLFGAAWVLGYIAQSAKAGVEALTLMSFTGESGVVSAGPVPLRYPTWFVLARVCAFSHLQDLSISEPRRIAGLLLSRDGCREVLLCNLGPDPVDVELHDFTKTGTIAVLDADTWESFRSAENPWDTLRRATDASVHRLGAYAVLSYIPADKTTLLADEPKRKDMAP